MTLFKQMALAALMTTGIANGASACTLESGFDALPGKCLPVLDVSDFIVCVAAPCGPGRGRRIWDIPSPTMPVFEPPLVR